LGGKGGVGKSTLTANVGACLTEFGKDVIVVDGNLTTPNLGFHLGVPLYPRTIHDAMKGKVRIDEAIFYHQSGLKVIPAGISLNDLREINPSQLSTSLLDLLGKADIIIIDAAAGLGKEALSALEASDDLVLVSTPDLPSITDSLKALKMAERLGTKPLGIVVNRVLGKRFEMTRSEIRNMLDLPIIAEIPEDYSVPDAISKKIPVVHYKPFSPAAQNIRSLSARLIGMPYTIYVPWYKKLFRL